MLCLFFNIRQQLLSKIAERDSLAQRRSAAETFINKNPLRLSASSEAGEI